LCRSYQANFIAPQCNSRGAKWLDSIDAIKRCSKNDFTRHLTPRMMHPIRHRNTTTVSVMDPMIAVGSAKALGLKAKPIYGSELSRATRARDEATQRVANILVHPTPNRGTRHPQASYLSLDWEVSFTPLCGLSSSHRGFLRGLLRKEARNDLVQI
jgi:hypothetical protein